MRNIARTLLILAGVTWGFGFIGNKYILDYGWTETQLLFVRFVSAFIFIFIIYFKRIIKASNELRKQGLLLGVFLFLGFFFQTWGLVYSTASNNALITAGYIIFLPFLSFFIDKIKVERITIYAGIITLIGIMIISVDFQDLHISNGDILTFIGAIFWAIHIFFLGKQSKKHDVIALMGYQLLTFSILITGIMFLTDGLPMLNINEDFKYNPWLIGVLLGFFCSFFAFTLQAFGQKHTNSSEAAILISTESVFGPIFAILFYNEHFKLTLLLGMILVFTGIVLSEAKASMTKKQEKTNREIILD